MYQPANPYALHLYKCPITLAGDQAIIKVKGHQHQWLAGGYDLEIGTL